jgi:hypothetical protein
VRTTGILHCTVLILCPPHTPLLCVCRPCNVKFIVQSYTPIFFHAAPKFSTHTRTLTFFRATLKFSVHTCILTFFRATPKFSACINTPIYCRAVPNFTYHKLFTAHHAFLVQPPMHIYFYAHQFLVNSAVEIGTFGLKFSPTYHRYSTTMKFVQFHPNNTNSTYATTNPCNLTFLE